MNEMSKTDWTPRWNPTSGLTMGPARPRAVDDPHLIQGFSWASTRVLDATHRADELRDRLRISRDLARELKDRRADLVRRLAQGKKVDPGEAGDIDREESNAAADAQLCSEVLARAEMEVTAANTELKAVLKAEAIRYLGRLRSEAKEAQVRFVEIQNEHNAREMWCRDVANMVQHVDNIEGWGTVLGISL